MLSGLLRHVVQHGATDADGGDAAVARLMTARLGTAREAGGTEVRRGQAERPTRYADLVVDTLILLRDRHRLQEMISIGHIDQLQAGVFSCWHLSRTMRNPRTYNEL